MGSGQIFILAVLINNRTHPAVVIVCVCELAGCVACACAVIEETIPLPTGEEAGTRLKVRLRRQHRIYDPGGRDGSPRPRAGASRCGARAGDGGCRSARRQFRVRAPAGQGGSSGPARLLRAVGPLAPGPVCLGVRSSRHTDRDTECPTQNGGCR